MRLTKKTVLKYSRLVSHNDIANAHRRGPLAKLNLQFLDGEFRIPNLALFEEMARKDKTNKRKYRASVADCDNFAAAFSANCGLRWGVNGIGFVCDVSGGHAYNVVFLDDPRQGIVVRLFEPQTDRFATAGSPNYKAQAGWVMMF